MRLAFLAGFAAAESSIAKLHARLVLGLRPRTRGDDEAVLLFREWHKRLTESAAALRAWLPR